MAGSVDREREHRTKSESFQSGATESAGNGVASFFRSRPRTRLTVLVGGVALVAVVAVMWWYYSGREATDDAQVDGHIVPIAARVGGTVLNVRVEDNQDVKAGTVLVEIDPKDYRVALQRAEADFADAQAALAAAEAGIPITATMTAGQVSSAGANVERAETGQEATNRDVEAARARLAAAQARLAEATANATRLTRDLERMKQLVAKDEISQQQYDAAVAAAEAGRATTESARAAVTEATEIVSVAGSRRMQAANVTTQARAELRTAHTAPDQIAVAKAKAQSARARLQQAQANLEQARMNLAYATVVAPANGRVSKKGAEPGQVIQPGQPLMAIVPLEDIWVTANFKETQLRNIRPGQAVSIAVDAYARSYRGHVDSVAAATGARFSLLPPENASGNYVKVVQRVPVRILLDKGQDRERLLRPGMSVVPTVFTR
ncbi:MAG TPA: HlyD family secretion protein [Vicinamibacterales bacterium]|jgi:membrane fusion protein (multidrug efflux system)